MRTLSYILLTGLFLFACQSPNNQAVKDTDPSKLRETIKEQIAEKKQLELIKEQLSRRHLSPNATGLTGD